MRTQLGTMEDRVVAIVFFCAVAVVALTGPVLGQHIALEASGDIVTVDDFLNVLARVDPLTGERTIISGAGMGTGILFDRPKGIAVEANGNLVVTDAGLGAVFRVDPATGDRAIVSGSSVGEGPILTGSAGLAVEASGDLVVTRASGGWIIRVDPQTGDRTLVSDSGTGTGPAFLHPGRIAVEASGDLVVTDGSLNAVLRVDPVTGDRSILSDRDTGAGPFFNILGPGGIAIEATGQIVVTHFSIFLTGVLRVDPVTGDRTIVSDAGTGIGPDFTTPTEIVVEGSGDLVTTEALNHEVLVRVDSLTGDRTHISSCGDGIISAGAECDDDNLADGDGCSAICEVEDGWWCAGQPSVCVAPGTCSATPAAGCSSPGKSSLVLKDTTNDASDKVVWKWLKGEETDADDFGDPTESTVFTFCMYDTTVAVPSLVVEAAGLSGADWKQLGPPFNRKGFKYKGSSSTEGGLRRVWLKAGRRERARIVVVARGDNLSLPGPAGGTYFNQDTEVVVQLQNSLGDCWATAFSAPGMKNDGESFKDKCGVGPDTPCP